jgi:hypothetical protein
VFSCRTKFHQEPRRAPHQKLKSQPKKTAPFNERQAATRHLLNLSTATMKMKAEGSLKATDKTRRYDTW